MEMARIKLATCRTRCICSLHWATCCFLFNFDNSTLYFVVAVSTAQSAGQLGPIKYSMPRWRSCQLGPTFQFLSRFYSKKVCTVEASNQRPWWQSLSTSLAMSTSMSTSCYLWLTWLLYPWRISTWKPSMTFIFVINIGLG